MSRTHTNCKPPSYCRKPIITLVFVIFILVSIAIPALHSVFSNREARADVGSAMVAVGDTHTVGLRSDGTLVAVGDDSYGECDVGSWNVLTSLTSPSPSPSPSPKVGYVLYMPGIIFLSGAWTAEERVTDTFPSELQSEFELYYPAYFCYKSSGGYDGGDAEYTDDDTKQHLKDSANALDEQIRDLINTWSGQSTPEIVIVAHSLGGAVAAYWASYADSDVLSAVRTVFTFDSPIAGIDVLRSLFASLFGGSATEDLANECVKERMEHGTKRVDFVQVGNAWDDVVSSDQSFTPHAWKSLLLKCPDTWVADYSERHDCSMENIQAFSLVKVALSQIPPLWANSYQRPLPMSVSEWRKDIQPGDILLCRSSTMADFVLTQGLGHFWTHAGIYIGDDMVVEAVAEGVKINPITDWDCDPKTYVEILRVAGATASQKSEAVSFTLEQENKPYWFNPVGKSQESNKYSWYSSELVWAAYKNQGIDIEDGPDWFSVYPQEIHDDEDTYVIGGHQEYVPDVAGFTISLLSPADIVVTDPDGLTISKELNEITGAVYIVEDVDGNGDLEDFVGVPNPKIGDYLIEVIPDADAMPTDTFSLMVSYGDSTIFLAENVPVTDIPDEPYVFELTGDGAESTLPVWLWPVVGVIAVVLVLLVVLIYLRVIRKP
jgi:pimeloyl-ACP methyl ester carboxylesterase